MKKIWSRLSAVQRICAGICIFYFLAAVFGPIFSPFPPDDFSSPALLPPGRVHLLGTDEMGHDIFFLAAGLPDRKVQAFRLFFLQ